MAVFYSVSRSGLKCLFWAFYGHKVFIPKDVVFPKGSIIAANHASFFDPPLVAVSWPEPIHFLARKSLFDVPLLSQVITGLNAHPLASGSELGALKAACRLLSEGKNVLIFPEGTRSFDGSIAPFKAGASLLSQKAKAPIIPVYIHGSFAVWPRQKQLPAPFGYQTACVFGPPILPEQFDDSRDGQQALTLHLQNEVQRLSQSSPARIERATCRLGGDRSIH